VRAAKGERDFLRRHQSYLKKKLNSGVQLLTGLRSEVRLANADLDEIDESLQVRGE